MPTEEQLLESQRHESPATLFGQHQNYMLLEDDTTAYFLESCNWITESRKSHEQKEFCHPNFG
jgi:hypothetical protein